MLYLKTVKNREEKNPHVKKKQKKVLKRGVIWASAFTGNTIELEFNNTALFSLCFIVFHS